LHLDFEWPSEHIGTQSADWAFDVVAYFPGSDEEAVAGEVKKTVSEVDQLIELMKMHGELSTAEAPRSGKQRNAFKKVAALRARKAPVLWVLGPGAYERVFNVSYLADLRVVLNDATRGDLHFARFSGSKGGEPPQL
jgi:Icc-related predicted phosphoesterase